MIIHFPRQRVTFSEDVDSGLPVKLLSLLKDTCCGQCSREDERGAKMAIEMHLQQISGLTRNALLTDHALNLGYSGERSARRAGNSLASTN